ncbi:hypothetical protein SAMN06296241_0932 [Salinimicrobium sediminis]|uniref:Uncharacterized protein n=1 Tax=Salinimicrobium sediminis TaxID=1343891 RepID=A0A285X4T4_9FLAO|nr:hypothetical protein SAMN06296241_0932 [Salinimicrobium sediminis]
MYLLRRDTLQPINFCLPSGCFEVSLYQFNYLFTPFGIWNLNNWKLKKLLEKGAFLEASSVPMHRENRCTRFFSVMNNYLKILFNTSEYLKS